MIRMMKRLVGCMVGLMACAALGAQGVKPLPSLHVEGK